MTCDPNLPVGTVCASDDETTPVVVVTVPISCENGKIVGYTPSGQPLFFICGPADELNTRTPVPDVCLPMGQMSQSLMPCGPATEQVTVAVDIPPVPSFYQLPATGNQVMPTMFFGSFVLLLGVVLHWFARR